MTKSEKLEALRDAQEKPFQVIETVEEIFPGDADVQMYFVPRLQIACFAEHRFLSDDLNIDDLIMRIEGEKEKSRKRKKK